MAVKAQAAPAAGAREGRNDVGAIGVETDLARVEALTHQPVVYVVGHRTLAAGGAVKIREIERHLDQLIGVDVLENGFRIDCHC